MSVSAGQRLRADVDKALAAPVSDAAPLKRIRHHHLRFPSLSQCSATFLLG